jgi:hypothetical protein
MKRELRTTAFQVDESKHTVGTNGSRFFPAVVKRARESILANYVEEDEGDLSKKKRRRFIIWVVGTKNWSRAE